MNSIIIKRYNAYMYFTDTDSLSDKQYDFDTQQIHGAQESMGMVWQGVPL